MLRSTLFNEKSLIRLKHWVCKSARKRFSMLSFVTIMIIGTVAFASNLFFLTATATYVGGSITQNTVWTLVDSPFVISQNVTVNQGATLTIEPGVEVKFGGDFSLIINGRLIANGTQNSMITFTSNKYQPSPGDWGTIEISGTQQSLLKYCSIQYATNGTTTEGGNVEVENSVVSNSYQYGISATNSIAQIQADQIANNSVGGVCVSGGNNQVTIQNNTISSNADGILLYGTNGTGVSGVNISKNIVLSNKQSGIHLNAGAYTNLIVLYNNVSANNDGFLVSGQGSTWITNNSVSYNSNGFFYAASQNHQAHWNDIYGNTMGMDVSSSATGMVVNATYNYWGDPSGPYHPSLNPAGKGNPVGGNGANLVFIFFLTHPISYIDQPPIASLWADKTVVPPNQPVTFIGTLSSASGRVDQYFFNFGDGQDSGWTTLSILVHNYISAGNYTATLKVMDDFGVTSVNTAAVNIKCLQKIIPLTVSLIPSSSAIGSGGQLSIAARVTNSTSPIAAANVTLFPTGGSMTPSSGLTNSTGYFNATFSAPTVTQMANVRMTASASKTGYGDGSDYKYLMILPPLLVQVTANPSEILSEAISNVTAQVTYRGAPVPNATVSIMSNYGNFTQGTTVTDSSGRCGFVFTAPATGTQLTANIVATATKTGYVNGRGQTNLTIEPKVLVVQVVANPAINSEMSTNVTVHVLYDSNPISGATVVMSSNISGSFAPANRTTDATGQCTFAFTAPLVTKPSNVAINATASETGYASRWNQTTLTVKLGTLIVQLASSPEVESGATSKITVQVTYNAKPVPDTTVTLSSAVRGTLSPITNSTDQNGNCEFVFTAPETTTQYTVAITANATKTGYISGRGLIGMTVNPPAAAGLPLVIILIVIAVVIVAVFLILFKLKILVISQKGE
jgi:parallel beta-helix repeat protein